MAIVLGVYLAHIIVGIWRDFFISLGRDFLSFWSTAYLAFYQGWEAAFNLQYLALIQQIYTPKVNIYIQQGYIYLATPAPYLPIYFLPFFGIIKLSPIMGYFLWSLFKIFIIVGYGRVWERRGLANPVKLIVFSFPFFLDVYWGNYSFVLIPVVGEMIYGLWRQKYMYAGAWAGVLWLKPALLPFGLLYVLGWGKRWLSVLKGWLMTTVLVWGGSWIMAGQQGIFALFRLLQDLWFAPAPTMGLTGGMNWRAIVLNLQNCCGNMAHAVNWLGISLGGIVLMGVVYQRFMQRRANLEISITYLALGALVVLAVGFAFGVHAHLHYLLAYTIPLAVGRQNTKAKFLGIVERWMLLGFVGAWFLVTPLLIGIKLLVDNLYTAQIRGWINFLGFGANALALNLFILWQGMRALNAFSDEL